MSYQIGHGCPFKSGQICPLSLYKNIKINNTKKKNRGFINP
jgi:hypothetical protein